MANEGPDLQDALKVLKAGQVYDEPEHDIKSGDWKYRCEGSVLDGRWLAIVFCFETIDTAILITVFSIRPRERRQ